eukprot:11934178-Prorocentrum_lima.AAC.1
MGCALSSIVFQPPSFPSTIPKSDVIELQTKHNSKIAGLPSWNMQSGEVRRPSSGRLFSPSGAD